MDSNSVAVLISGLCSLPGAAAEDSDWEAEVAAAEEAAEEAPEVPGALAEPEDAVLHAMRAWSEVAMLLLLLLLSLSLS